MTDDKRHAGAAISDQDLREFEDLFESWLDSDWNREALECGGSGDVAALYRRVKRFLVDDSTKVADTCDLKNDYPVPVVDRADVQKGCDHIAGGPWCFNNPERKEWPAPISSSGMYAPDIEGGQDTE